MDDVKIDAFSSWIDDVSIVTKEKRENKWINSSAIKNDWLRWHVCEDFYPFFGGTHSQLIIYSKKKASQIVADF